MLQIKYKNFNESFIKNYNAKFVMIFLSFTLLTPIAAWQILTLSSVPTKSIDIHFYWICISYSLPSQYFVN